MMFKVDTTDLRQAVAPPLFTDQDVQQILRELGTTALSEVGENFEKLSRRQSGIDGDRWKELTPATEIRKARKRGWRASGRGASGKQGLVGAVAAGKSSGSSPPRSLIGVDDGFLRNAIVPTYTGPDKIFEIDNRSKRVTVGFGRSYADDFDAVRTLIPTATPPDWIQEMETRLEEFGETLLHQRLRGRATD